MKVKDLKQKHPSILIYSDPGGGKTSLIETLGGGLQIIDCDDGAISGLSLADEHQPARHEVDILQYFDEDPKLPTAFEKTKQYVIKVKNLCRQDKFPFKALAIDSLSALATSAIRTILKNSGGPAKVEIQHWGLAINEINNLMTLFRSLPLVTILTAHTQVVTVSGIDRVQVACFGKNLPNQICGSFDEVWFLEAKRLTGKTVYQIRTQPTGVQVCRTRGQLDNNLPTSLGLPKILEKIGYQFNCVSTQPV
jgi:hypothetical protein